MHASWVYIGDDSIPTTSSTLRLIADATPDALPCDYGGVMLADGYAGYDGVVAGNQITSAGCWGRLKESSSIRRRLRRRSREAVERVRALYAVEAKMSQRK
ncbi:MAG: transposase [Terracidiphilus sp.]|jgi:hypothetical protein